MSDPRNVFARRVTLSGFLVSAAILFLLVHTVSAQGTRLLRQPDLHGNRVVFAYGGDLWLADVSGGDAVRLTSTPAVESFPHFSPDGKIIAFTSSRSGSDAVYTVPVSGGEPSRLTWYPSNDMVRGWAPDGKSILYASARESAPAGHERLWSVPASGGPSVLLPAPFGADGSYSADGSSMVIDESVRWDEEWQDYRGGQNLALVLLNLNDLSETLLPGDLTADTHPVWIGDRIFFLSDRDWTVNIWSYGVNDRSLTQHTEYTGTDIKYLSGSASGLVFERGGWIHTFDVATGETKQLHIDVRGDFPWSEERWEDVSRNVSSFALSPTGKRVVMEARGEIFTVPADKGSTRNITRSDAVHDKNPVWSPDGSKIAWFSDDGSGYLLRIAAQDGTGDVRSVSLGESKMVWEQAWSSDGKYIAFVDDDVRVRVLDVENGSIQTVDVGGINIERGGMGLSWSHDSHWLVYSVTGPNNFRRVRAWSETSGGTVTLTNPMADASSPTFDRDGKHLYFLASTDVGLGSGWANTSAMQANAQYAVYVMLLQDDLNSPFEPKSDEEEVKDDEEEADKAEKEEEDEKKEEASALRIDLDGIDRRILALPLGTGSYGGVIAGPAGTVFIQEYKSEGPNILHKFSLKDAKTANFAEGVNGVAVSEDGKKILLRQGSNFRLVGTDSPPSPGSGSLSVDLQMRLDRKAEWGQIFEEAWRYQKDFFYDANLHGRDWQVVHDRYAPLVPYVRHRSDLNYILDQMNGELSVGHSFVFGGDFPETESNFAGLLGADLVASNGGWKINRIYSTESWNPGLSAPLDRPGLKVDEGHFLVGIERSPLTDKDDPYQFLEGTAGRQTVLHINDKPSMDGAWTVIVEPIRNEGGLRQRAWVEDNRRMVDELSGGKLAYIWVPNTGGGGIVSFNRYFFSQQDKEGAIIDERFNGGGLLDDYMVDLMTRSVRAGITNEVPNGKPMRLPAGILGPKVLLVNQLAGSGGDYFPWVFRQQNAGPLVGKRTWGGLVKSSVHYAMVDGGALTAPDNAIFDPIKNEWVAENKGVPPDIDVRQDARSVAAGKDPQLERAVLEALRLLEANPTVEVKPPPYSTPAKESNR